MLLVLGSIVDGHPAALVDRWRAAGRAAALVTPAGLSQPGWTLHVGHPGESTAVVAGRAVPAADVDAVVCALPFIAPAELVHVTPDDRDYVAQEMGAFLLAWLHSLPCPVLDTPTALSLSGSGRSGWEWAALADSVELGGNPEWDGATASVTVVGGRPVGDVDPDLAAAAARVAAAAGSGLITLHFALRPSHDTIELVGASARPEVGNAEVAGELLTLIKAMS